MCRVQKGRAEGRSGGGSRMPHLRETRAPGSPPIPGISLLTLGGGLLDGEPRAPPPLLSPPPGLALPCPGASRSQGPLPGEGGRSTGPAPAAGNKGPGPAALPDGLLTPERGRTIGTLTQGGPVCCLAAGLLSTVSGQCWQLGSIPFGTCVLCPCSPPPPK